AAHATGAVVPLGQLVQLALLSLLAMSVPVNIGGWGPREGVTAWAFGAAGLSAAQGVTIAVAYGLFAFVAALPGVIVLVVRAIATARSSEVKRSTGPTACSAAAPHHRSDAPRPARRGASRSMGTRPRRRTAARACPPRRTEPPPAGARRPG